MKMCPCRDCDRHGVDLHCHSTCREHLEWVEHVKDLKARKHSAEAFDRYAAENHARIHKCLRRYRRHGMKMDE